MTRILMSCYRCDPLGVSEAYSGYKWAEMVSARYPTTVCVPSFSADRVREALSDSGSVDTRVVAVPMPDIDAKWGSLGSAIKPGFFVYERRLLSSLRRGDALDGVGLVWHRTPMSFRNRTRLYSLGLPLVMGPVGGGLRNPDELSDYFRDEGVAARLKAFDGAMLGSRWWMRPFDDAVRILATCDYVRDVLPKRLAEKTVTILDIGTDEVSGTRRPRGEAPFTVLYVGRLVRYKGPILALEAFARFVASVDAIDVRMVFVGDGPEMHALRTRAAQPDLAGRVEFTGVLARDEALARYGDADVFLFPSITEASGNVYIEAMTAGLPLVVVDNGGGRCIPSPECAIQVAVAEPESLIAGLSDGLRRLHDDEALRERMGAAGQTRVRERYTWGAIAGQTTAVIDRVLRDTTRTEAR